MALEFGQAHSRESLIGLLWTELPETDTRNNLRVSLSHLRKRFNGMDTAVPTISTNRTKIRFDLNEAITLDVGILQEILSQTEPTHTAVASRVRTVRNS